jgi:hypothetical protein
MATARTTVTAEQESHPVAFMSGETIEGPSVTIAADYRPGDEDKTIHILGHLISEVIAKINAARPAAASTPQEGTTP